MKNYQIIATLGPASRDESVWAGMLAAGATDFRLNTSHLMTPDLMAWMERLLPFLSRQAPDIRVILDLQGSKWRLGRFTPFDLHEGETVNLIYGETADQASVLPVPHRDLFRLAPSSSGQIAINDGKILLRVEGCKQALIGARVERGGPVQPRKGITFSGGEERREALSDKDQETFEKTHTLGNIGYAISYLRDEEEMTRYRTLCGGNAWLIAKLERRTAVQAARGIAGPANALWVCRGDLGAEVGLPAMAEAVASITRQVREMDVPVIMAGQVLEHMVNEPQPTRSEVCYLYDCLQSGYAGFVLSDEAAVGRFPVESVRAAAMFKA